LLAPFAALIPAAALQGQAGVARPSFVPAETSFYNEAKAKPQSSYQESTEVNGGTLSWTDTLSTGTCGNNGKASYSMITYSSFVYSYEFPSPFYTNPQEYIPVSVPFPGTSASYVFNATQNPPYCPADGPYPSSAIPMWDSNSFYRVVFDPTAPGTGSATMESFSTGGVIPQYVVMSVVYAPPGPGGTSVQSSVNYTNTTEAGTNTTWSSSFTNASSYSTTVSLLTELLPLGGSGSGGASWSQETDDSQSIAINQTSSVSDVYGGTQPANTVGLNHDNDTILLWLNPALDCVAEPEWTVLPIPAATECIIYDPMMAPGDPDNPLADIVQLPVGELNGDYSMQALNPDTYNILQSHGISPAQFLSIAQNDPYYNCNSSIPCVQNIGTVIGSNFQRFDLQTNAGVIDFGNNGNSTIYPVVYQETSTEGQGASYSYAITNTFVGQSFDALVKEQISNTQTWTSKWAETTTSMVGQTAQATVKEPSGGYSGPSQFEVYKDNVYGTFMFYPTQ